MVCMGTIGAPHGVRGEVRIKSHTADPQDIASYGPLFDEDGGRRFEVRVRGHAKGVLIARIEGIGDRDAAAALEGTGLYVPRDALPETPAEEFYHADLIGLRVEGVDGATMGTVRAVENYGAGDILEIGLDRGGGAMTLPFTRDAVPEIDLAGGRIVVDPPAEIAAAKEPK